jgi:hypothetical protein
MSVLSQVFRSNDVARTLVSAASRLVSTLFSEPGFDMVLQARKSVETSLDTAGTSARATSAGDRTSAPNLTFGFPRNAETS